MRTRPTTESLPTLHNLEQRHKYRSRHDIKATGGDRIGFVTAGDVPDYL